MYYCIPVFFLKTQLKIAKKSLEYQRTTNDILFLFYHLFTRLLRDTDAGERQTNERLEGKAPEYCPYSWGEGSQYVSAYDYINCRPLFVLHVTFLGYQYPNYELIEKKKKKG